jgi:hypothetical protein
VKARNQTTANWADALSKQFNGSVERQVPGLNAAIFQIPTNNVENLVRAARGACPRIPIWSNPLINYDGVPAGTDDYENEADVINDTAPIIAGFQ